MTSFFDRQMRAKTQPPQRSTGSSIRLRILITDAHELAALGAMRSLGQAGHTVIAAYPHGLPQPASVWSRYCTTVLRHPDAWRYQFEFRAWLREQIQCGNFDAVWPISEAAIAGVDALRQEISRDVLLILPHPVALAFTLSKFQATRHMLALGIPCPRTVFVSDGTPDKVWNEDFSLLQFPLVIKTDNYLTTKGIYEKGESRVAADLHEANNILYELRDKPTRILAQELVPGSGAGAFFLRFNDQIYRKFAHRRLHEVPYTGGVSSFRESCSDEELISLGETILKAIDYEGVAMVEFRRRASDGKPLFLEINGRLWGSLALALHAGIDFPKALLECYQYGHPLQKSSVYRSGIKCRNIFPGEIRHLISILRAKPLPQRESPPSKLRALGHFFLLSLNPTIRHDYFWWTDPLPGIAQAGAITKSFGMAAVKKAIQKVHTYQEDRLLQKIRLAHQTRSDQPRYFPHPLHRILFLCYGNICRSPFAEYYWNTKIREHSLPGPLAISAGFYPRTGRKTPPEIADLVTEYGIDLTPHHSRLLTRQEVESADAIFVMDRWNYQDLKTLFPHVKHKTYFLGLFAEDGRIEIADPYTMPRAEARLCYQQLVQSLNGLLKRLYYDNSDFGFRISDLC